jgi:hypothetical protein
MLILPKNIVSTSSLTKILIAKRLRRSSYNAMAPKVFLKAKNFATLSTLETPERIRAKELTAMTTMMSFQSLSVMTRSHFIIGPIPSSKGATELQVTPSIKISVCLSSL